MSDIFRPRVPVVPDAGGAGIKVFRSSLISERCPWLLHGFSGRPGGGSAGKYHSLNLGLHVQDEPEAVLENRRLFTRSLFGIEMADQLVVPAQVHSSGCAIVDEADGGRGAFSVDSAIPNVDALVSETSGLPVMLFYADCVPVLLVDPVRRVFAAVHAGWRGTASGVGPTALRMMMEHLGARIEDCLAWIGPSIGPCCYEVDAPVYGSVMATLENSQTANAEGRSGEGRARWSLDLKKVNRKQLLALGLRPEHVETADVCTCCEKEMLFSYRRDGVTGRMALAAMIA